MVGNLAVVRGTAVVDDAGPGPCSGGWLVPNQPAADTAETARAGDRSCDPTVLVLGAYTIKAMWPK